MNSDERPVYASRAYAAGLDRARTTKPPRGQKYAPGTRVRVAADLGPSMSHFYGAGKVATVEYTYAHAYGGLDVHLYSLNFGKAGSVAWYHEDQLTPIGKGNA